MIETEDDYRSCATDPPDEGITVLVFARRSNMAEPMWWVGHLDAGQWKTEPYGFRLEDPVEWTDLPADPPF